MTSTSKGHHSLPSMTSRLGCVSARYVLYCAVLWLGEEGPSSVALCESGCEGGGEDPSGLVGLSGDS
ncbi:hypothetical protein E2C01_023548 [Portunus trituberculatus]|uniref:Uncharacterized protein n=1 Tax=Portunus trituberculatus TaxID=210409 RepID=A0A5B7EAU6_PORTR|nr:hypothetical protein [Portunus trituberculatus]